MLYDFEAGRSLFRAVLKVDPDHVEALIELAKALAWRQGSTVYAEKAKPTEAELSEAFQLLYRANELDDSHVECEFLLGQFCTAYREECVCEKRTCQLDLDIG